MRIPGFLLVAVLFHAAAVHAQTARIELHPLRSMTLSDQEFLNGVKEGTPVTIAGELRLPRAQTDRVPAVVLLHGSGGLSASHQRWADELNGAGIAVFMVDSFSSRGLVSTSADQGQLGRLAMIIDAYRALELLSQHYRIDPARIALLGFSRGGQSALYASLRRFQRMHGPKGVEYAAYLPFYASCNTTFRQDTEIADRPIRIHHGAADDYVPVAPCRAYVARLREAGRRNVELVEYPGAHHSFDNPANKQPVRAERSQSTRECVLQEDTAGRVINTRTGKVFDYQDTCVRLGPTLAYHPEAHVAAVASVKEFLAAAFRR